MTQNRILKANIDLSSLEFSQQPEEVAMLKKLTGLNKDIQANTTYQIELDGALRDVTVSSDIPLINPMDLVTNKMNKSEQKEQERLLAKIIKQENKNPIKAGYHAILNDDDSVSHFNLTHDILLRKNKQRFEVYRDIDENFLGRGSFGRVVKAEATGYLKRDKNGQEDRAIFKLPFPNLPKKNTPHERIIKMLVHDPLAMDMSLENFLEYTEKEFSISKKARHLRYKESIVGDTDERGVTTVYLIAERKKGDELKKAIANMPRDNPDSDAKEALIRQKMAMTLACIRALKEQCHDQGIYHRDIKPGNMIIDMTNLDKPEINNIDYGLAIGNKFGHKKAGTPAFFPPEYLNWRHCPLKDGEPIPSWLLTEKLRKDRSTSLVDYQKADIWALGVTIHKIWEGTLETMDPLDRATRTTKEILRGLLTVDPDARSTDLQSYIDFIEAYQKDFQTYVSHEAEVFDSESSIDSNLSSSEEDEQEVGLKFQEKALGSESQIDPAAGVGLVWQEPAKRRGSEFPSDGSKGKKPSFSVNGKHAAKVSRGDNSIIDEEMQLFVEGLKKHVTNYIKKHHGGFSKNKQIKNEEKVNIANSIERILNDFEKMELNADTLSKLRTMLRIERLKAENSLKAVKDKHGNQMTYKKSLDKNSAVALIDKMLSEDDEQEAWLALESLINNKFGED